MHFGNTAWRCLNDNNEVRHNSLSDFLCVGRKMRCGDVRIDFFAEQSGHVVSTELSTDLQTLCVKVATVGTRPPDEDGKRYGLHLSKQLLVARLKGVLVKRASLSTHWLC